MRKIKGLLIDLDGVLYTEDRLIAGAIETLARLRSARLPFRFLTNTTIRSRQALADKLHGFGIEARVEEIFSTCVVAARWLAEQGTTRLHVLLPEEPRVDFSGFKITDSTPEVVLVGDLGEGFTYARLNKAFRLLKQGARLVALQKNRFWQTADGLAMDVGAFVAALEYAAETAAVVIGKPNRAYFEMALADMKLQPEEVAMVGDDLFTDIRGGQAAGLTTVLCQTGKFRPDDLEKSDIQPDHVIDSIAELPRLLDAG